MIDQSSDQDTRVLVKQALIETTAAGLPRLLPSQVFERTRWQRGYAAKLLITDSFVVCAAVHSRSMFDLALRSPRPDTTSISLQFLGSFVPYGYRLWPDFVLVPPGSSAPASRSIAGWSQPPSGPSGP